MHVAVVAGETSGDQLGSGVLASLRRLVGDLRVTGVGGNAMETQGLESLYAMEDISLMGLDGVTEKLLGLFESVDHFSTSLLTIRPTYF